MKSPALILLVPALALASCRDGSNLNKQQQQYEVVQEGVSNGSNPSSLTAGQAAPPLTGTAVDTTTAFQLPVAAPNTSTAPGTIAETLAPPAYGSVPPAYQPAPPATAPRTASAPRPAPAAPRPAPSEQAEAPPPVPTLTGGFTSGTTSRPPATEPPAEPAEPAEEDESQEPEEPEPAPPPADGTAPPPPGEAAGHAEG
jgi:hypothetical protein